MFQFLVFPGFVCCILFFISLKEGLKVRLARADQWAQLLQENQQRTSELQQLVASQKETSTTTTTTTTTAASTSQTTIPTNSNTSSQSTTTGKNSNIFYSLLLCSTICLQSVWPDWATFERLLWQIFLQKQPRYLATVWAIWKNVTFLL